MGILKKLFPFCGETPCAPCKEKMAALKEEHRRARQRIERMEASLDAASMNGEERWFLTLQKLEEDRDHG